MRITSRRVLPRFTLAKSAFVQLLELRLKEFYSPHSYSGESESFVDVALNGKPLLANHQPEASTPSTWIHPLEPD